MITKSVWNNPNILTSENEFVAADEGYWDTAHINFIKPFSKKQIDANPNLKKWNKTFNRDRGLIERSFAIFKETWEIFEAPWKRHRDLFPLALRVCIKLMNKYWRLPQNTPPGLCRQLAKDD